MTFLMYLGQPHSTTEPTTENRVDPAGGQSKSTKQSRFLKIKRYLFPDGNNCSRSVETTKLKSNHALWIAKYIKQNKKAITE